MFGDPNDRVLKINMPCFKELQTKVYMVIDKWTHNADTCVITSGFYDPFLGN